MHARAAGAAGIVGGAVSTLRLQIEGPKEGISFASFVRLHDPGRVFCDLAVMLADGGRCVSDLVALGSQPALFGDVASVSTARRVLLSVGEAELDRLRRARAQARARAWAAGAAPEEVILDFDATPTTAHSDKEGAAGH